MSEIAINGIISPITNQNELLPNVYGGPIRVNHPTSEISSFEDSGISSKKLLHIRSIKNLTNCYLPPWFTPLPGYPAVLTQKVCKN